MSIRRFGKRHSKRRVTAKASHCFMGGTAQARWPRPSAMHCHIPFVTCCWVHCHMDSRPCSRSPDGYADGYGWIRMDTDGWIRMDLTRLHQPSRSSHGLVHHQLVYHARPIEAGQLGPACTVEFVSETDGVCNEYLSSFSLGCISRPRLQFVVFGDEPAMGERNKEYHQVKLAEVRLRAKICFLALENLWRE